MMLARCLHNTGEALGHPLRSAFHTTSTVFHVTPGESYQVLGLGLFEETLVVLVLDETDKPNWLPSGLFDFGSSLLPEGWRFALCDGAAASGAAERRGWIALWGYPDLVESEAHRNGLVERDPEALQVFFREAAKER